MKPTYINQVLDYTMKARKMGLDFVPNFVGDSGIGKSAVCQQWVKKQQKTNTNFKFLDLRIAYFENPDLVGLPLQLKDEKTGEWITIHCVPEFFNFNKDDVGLILLEEPNRATTGVMNCLMQILTDRIIGKVKLPEGMIMAACINPEGINFDVNNTDTALKNRFVEFEINYDHKTFVEYMEKKGFDDRIQMYFGKGEWVYTPSDKIKDGKYVSSRSIERLDTALKTGFEEDSSLFFECCNSILGQYTGKSFYTFITDKRPILTNDLLDDKASSLLKLKEFCKDKQYQGDMVNMTVESVINNATLDDEDNVEKKLIGMKTIVDIMEIIPKDQAAHLFLSVLNRLTDPTNAIAKHNEIVKKYPSIKTSVAGRLRNKKG